jgi:hypothetical protein
MILEIYEITNQVIVEEPVTTIQVVEVIERILTSERGPQGPSGSQDLDEIHLFPKSSSNGPEGTVFYCNDDNHVYVGTE